MKIALDCIQNAVQIRFTQLLILGPLSLTTVTSEDWRYHMISVKI
jgi:hypothetical protein